MSRILLPASFFVAIIIANTASAALIAFDDFESYADNSALNTQNGGTGWTTPWNSIAGVTAQNGVVPGFGTSMQIGIATANESNVVRRSFAPQTDTLYVGFHLRTANFDSEDFLQIYFNQNFTTTENSSVSGGLRNQGIGGDNFYFARLDGFANSDNTDQTHADGDTALVVFKFTDTAAHGTNYDRADIFINQLTEGAPDATVMNVDSGTSVLSTLHIRAFSFEGGERVYIDNLAIGTTFSDVNNVPEPSSFLVLAGLACCCGAGFWRKRRNRN